MRTRKNLNGAKAQLGGISSSVPIGVTKRKKVPIRKNTKNVGALPKSRLFVGKIEDLKNHFKSKKKLVVATEIARSFGMKRTIGLEEYAINLQNYLLREKISNMPAVSIIQLVREMQKKGLIEVK